MERVLVMLFRFRQILAGKGAEMNVKRELTFAPLMESSSVLRTLWFMKKQTKNRDVRIMFEMS